MKRILNHIRLNLKYYSSILSESMTAFCFNLSFFIKNRRLPRKASKESIAEFKQYLKMKKSGEN